MPTKVANARKAVAKKAGGTRRPLSEEARAKLALNLVKARAARAAKRNGTPVKKAAKKSAAKKTAGKRGVAKGTVLSDDEKASRAGKTARSRSVRSYLEWLSQGEGTAQRVQLRGIDGFDGFSTDPDEVARAADVLEAQTPSTNDVMDKLHMVKRVRDLRAAVDELREFNEGPRASFIRDGKAWCEDNGFTYWDLRALKVPATTLREAGIEP